MLLGDERGVAIAWPARADRMSWNTEFGHPVAGQVVHDFGGAVREILGVIGTV